MLRRDRLVVGELWDDPADLIVITTNGLIRKGQLSMGRGVALQAKMRYPRLPTSAADRITDDKTLYRQRGFAVYGFTLVRTEAVGETVRKILGLFQTKYDPQAPASIALIGYSAIRLNHWLSQYYPQEDEPNFRVAMAFPGIGHGHLAEADVWPILDDLDERVYVYKLPEGDTKHEFSTKEN